MQIFYNAFSVHDNLESVTARKLSKYAVISGPYFPAFGLNTERYYLSVFGPNAGKYGPKKKIRIWTLFTSV